MLIREEEANQYFCPESRVVIAEDRPGHLYESAAAFNRVVRVEGQGQVTIHDQPNGTHCLGARCAAWREAPNRAYYGYCGKAGPPADVFTENVDADSPRTF